MIHSYTDTHQTGTKPACCNPEFLCQSFVKFYERIIDFVKDGFNVIIIIIIVRGRDSSVGTETSYGLDGPGIETQWGGMFSAPVQTGRGAHPSSCTMGTGSFPELKRPGRGVDHPPHLAPSLKKE